MMNLTFSKLSMSVAALALLAVFGLAGCGKPDEGSTGSGGGDTGTSSTGTKVLSGTAATGAPIASGAVTLKDSVGVTKTTTTDAAGNYSFDVSATQFPAMLKVQPVSGATLIYSAAVSPGTANINPLTSLVIYEGVGRSKSLNDIFLNGNFKTLLTGDNIEIGKSVVLNNFAPQLQAKNLLSPTIVDLITTPMSANGSGIDAVLDSIKVTIGDQSVTVKDSGGTTLAYDPKIESEDAASQRKVAAALFRKDDGTIDETIQNCKDDSVGDSNCPVRYNYNLWGMPGCWLTSGSNYIGHYQTKDGINWKHKDFRCPDVGEKDYDTKNIYDASGHTGIDMAYKNEINRKFYAISSGKIIRINLQNDCGAAYVGNDYNIFAVYVADPFDPNNTSKGITTLYLHASVIKPVSSVTKKELLFGDSINVGDYIGNQGNKPNYSYHVHFGVRPGKRCDDLNPNDSMPPVATALRYLANHGAASSTQPADTTAPTTPTGLAATAASSSQVNLTWDSSTDTVGVTGYKIYRDGTYLKPASSTTSSDTGLSASTPYCYQVSAYDAAGNESNKSTQVCATTQTATTTQYTLTVSKSGTGSGTVQSKSYRDQLRNRLLRELQWRNICNPKGTCRLRFNFCRLERRWLFRHRDMHGYDGCVKDGYSNFHCVVEYGHHVAAGGDYIAWGKWNDGLRQQQYFGHQRHGLGQCGCDAGLLDE